MVHSEKHLLEAFQESGALKPQAPASAQSSSVPAQPVEHPDPAAGLSAGWLSALAGHPKRQDPRVFVYLALGLLLLGSSLLLWYWKPWDNPAPDVHAAGSREAGPERSAAPAAAQPPKPLNTPAADLWPGQAALRDPANLYTLQVITYENSPANVTRATQLAQFFREQGLPACSPYAAGKYLYLLIGAGPTSADLQELQRRVRALPNPEGKVGDFRDAQIVQAKNFRPG